MNPPIIYILKNEGETKLPNTSGKRQAGRPKKNDSVDNPNMPTQQRT